MDNKVNRNNDPQAIEHKDENAFEAGQLLFKEPSIEVLDYVQQGLPQSSCTDQEANEQCYMVAQQELQEK